MGRGQAWGASGAPAPVATKKEGEERTQPGEGGSLAAPQTGLLTLLTRQDTQAGLEGRGLAVAEKKGERCMLSATHHGAEILVVCLA